MPNAKKKKESVGVIVGRFQTYEPHEGHLYTLEHVMNRHEETVVVLGVPYAASKRNPLSFGVRKAMLKGMYPNRKLIIVPSEAMPPSYANRSSDLDKIIFQATGGKDAEIYGARDSIVHTYEGKFPVHTVRTVYAGSATKMREKVDVVDSVDFRKGYIKAVNDRKPIFYPTVDVAILSPNQRRILLIELYEENGKLRFPGSFFLPGVDRSYEAAGVRCLKKETLGICTTMPQILRSCIIEDWRYRKTSDGIITLLTRVTYSEGNARPGRGIKAVHWVDYADVPSVIAPIHQPLAALEPWYGQP